jgi:hypothetical protein
MIPGAIGNQGALVVRGQAGSALAPSSSSPASYPTGVDLSPLAVSQAAGDVARNSVISGIRAWQTAHQPTHDAAVDVVFGSADSSEGLPDWTR